MSQKSTTPDLMERQKRLTDAANRRDGDAVMAFYAPDGVWDMSPMGMGVYEGQAAVRGFIEDWWSSYEKLGLDAEETLDLGNGVGFACSSKRAVQWAAAASWSCVTSSQRLGRRQGGTHDELR